MPHTVALIGVRMVAILVDSPPALCGLNGLREAAAIADAKKRHVEPRWMPPPSACIGRLRRVFTTRSSVSTTRGTGVTSRLRPRLRRSELIEATAGTTRRGGVAGAPRVPRGLSYMRTTAAARRIKATSDITAPRIKTTLNRIPAGAITQLGRATLSRTSATGFRDDGRPIGPEATLCVRHNGLTEPMPRITPVTQSISGRMVKPM